MMPSGADAVVAAPSEARQTHTSPNLVLRVRVALSGGDIAVVSFAFSITIAILCRGWALAVALAFCLALAAVVYPAGLHVLVRRRTWVLLVLLVATSTLVGPDPSWTLGPFGVSLQGAIAGVNMVMRAQIIIVAVMGLVSTVPIDQIGSVLERTGLHGLGFAVGVAFNLLPLIERSLVTSWHAMRLRAGLRRPLTALGLLLVAAVTSSLRCADEVVLAAEARAFDPGSTRGSRFTWRLRVIPLAVTLAAVATFFVLVLQ
jgi:energy-coupling factor transporter transmembrane protein EcfT